MTVRSTVIVRIVLLVGILLGFVYALSVSTYVPAEAQPGPPIRIKEKRELPEHAKLRLKEIRDRVRRDRGRLVADPDDEDVWASYVAAAGALALIGLGLVMVRRNESY